MNTLVPTIPTLTTPSKKTLWLFALASPVALGPIWCLTMGERAGGLGTLSGLVLLMLLVASSATDLSRRKIFNWATYSAAAWALLINMVGSWSASETISQLGVIGFRQSLLGFATCFGVMMFAYCLARGGAGDVKLAAAIGALVGVEQGLLAIAVSYILAGVAILAWSVWTQGPLKLLAAMGRFFGSLLLPIWISPPTKTERVLLQKPIPLAGFFAVGTLLVVLGII